MQNEYLNILGLSPGADKKDIKAAYRKLAKKYHPDISKNKEAKSNFIKVTEAYKFLTEVGPKPNHENINFNYDPQRAEYNTRREQAKEYARKRAREEALYQQSVLRKFYTYFNFVAALVVAFNAVLIIDYFLPKETHQKDIISATEIYRTNQAGNSRHLYDQLDFVDLELRFPKNSLPDIASPKALLFTTPVFNTLKNVKIEFKTGSKTLTPINRLYRLMVFMIPMAFLFTIIYYYLNERHYNKTTFAVVTAVLFLIQVFLVFRYMIN